MGKSGNVATIPLLVILVLLLAAELTLTHFSHLLPTHLVGTPHISAKLTNQAQQCPYALVYNKPAKTGSSTIFSAISKWAKRENRTLYACSGYVRFNQLVLSDCIPEDKSGCAVVAMHIELNDNVIQLLRERLGDFKLMTSTRPAAQRILSEAMQWHGLFHEDASKNLSEIKQYLLEYNPWSLYNYHAGATEVGSCPLTRTREMMLFDIASRYDFVLDASLRKETNKILNASNLFQLSDERLNVRGTADLKLDIELLRLLKNVSCVEDMLHKVLRMRMAFQYERATGKPCLRKLRYPETCFNAP